MASIFDVLDGRGQSQNSASQQFLLLFNAASRGNSERVKSLLDQSMDPGVLVNGFNAFHIACKKGHEGVVRTILSHIPTIISSLTSDGRTGCMLACFEGHHCVAAAIDEMCPLSGMSSTFLVVDDSGNSALHYGAWGGHLEIVRFILESVGKGTDLNSVNPLAENKEGLTALDMAAVGNHVSIIEYILSLPSSLEVDCSAATIAAIEESSSAYADRNERCESGYSFLHRAAQYGSLSSIKMLVSKSITAAAVDNPNTTLHCSNSHGNRSSLSSIVNKHANNGYTPLHLACRHGYLDVVNYLIEDCGADVNAIGGALLTPLHSACIGGYTSIVKRLLALGADPCAENEVGATALHLAAGNGRHDICSILSEIPSIKVLALDADECTPIDAALSSGYTLLACTLGGYGYVQQKTWRMMSLVQDIGWN